MEIGYFEKTFSASARFLMRQCDILPLIIRLRYKMRLQLKTLVSEEIESLVVAIIRRYMPVGMKYKVFLFGSRATGHGTERSDHDVGIEAEGNISFSVLANIRLDVDALPTLRKVDVVDFGRVNAAFKAVAKERTKELYVE